MACRPRGGSDLSHDEIAQILPAPESVRMPSTGMAGCGMRSLRPCIGNDYYLPPNDDVRRTEMWLTVFWRASESCWCDLVIYGGVLQPVRWRRCRAGHPCGPCWVTSTSGSGPVLPDIRCGWLAARSGRAHKIHFMKNCSGGGGHAAGCGQRTSSRSGLGPSTPDDGQYHSRRRIG